MDIDHSDYDFMFKVIVLGDSGVGKSSIVVRFADDSFNTSHISTIGVDFKIRTVDVDDKRVKLQIWDTAGQERFRTIVNSYYRNCHVIIIVFDLTDKRSFRSANLWHREAEHHVPDSRKVKIVIVGNKADLKNKREISTQDAQDFADSIGADYIETSAKDSYKISELFVESARKLVADHFRLLDNVKKEDDVKQGITLGVKDETKGVECCGL
jgi:small GTP-binding protein